jgi:hypothetical protein
LPGPLPGPLPRALAAAAKISRAEDSDAHCASQRQRLSVSPRGHHIHRRCDRLLAMLSLNWRLMRRKQMEGKSNRMWQRS